MKITKNTEPHVIMIADDPRNIRDWLENQIYSLVHYETTGEDMPPLHEYYEHLPVVEQIKELLSTSLGQDYQINGVDFVEFLVYHKAYEAYLSNLGEKNFHKVMEQPLQEGYISETFTWIDTEEGWEFWAELDALWQEEIGFA